MAKDKPLLHSVDDADATRILPIQDAAALIAQEGATVIVGAKTASVPLKVASDLTSGAKSTSFAPTQAMDTNSLVAASSRFDAATTVGGLLPKGARVAEFEIIRLIGQGGFGVVYEAWDHALERVVAIKEYMPASLANRQQDGNIVPLSERHQETFDAGMRSFINEARLLAQFDHPALLKVYRFWQERGTTYMVMPLYQGQTLKEALAERKGKVDQVWLLDIVDGVTQALAVMHAADCYHRDIAPDNIMLLHPNGQPVVLDFGAARRVISDMTQAITVILKPGYAPIEQYSETPDMKQGAWTDVYALSAVMYSAVTGHPPPPSVARMINDRCAPLSGDAALQEQFSPRVLQAIDAGLAVTPDKRLPSMAALRQALRLPAVAVNASAVQTRAFAPALTTVAKPSGTSQKRSLVWGVAGLSVVAVAGAMWWSMSGKTRSAVAISNPQVAVPVSPSAASVPVAPPISPTQPGPTTPLDSLTSLAAGANSEWLVSAKPGKEEVQIGKDKLAFQVMSKKPGFAYVYLLSSSGDLYLLFPNAIDKRNQLTSETEVALPRASWAMDAGGPAGVNKFFVVVSDHEMDMSSTGFRFDGVFGKFPPSVLVAMEATRGNGKSPLLGTPICPQINGCSVNYGAASFKIIEK
jgi:serine/threonine protein kinase